MSTRRPITPDEVPHLELAGALMRSARVRLGISQGALADAALLSVNHVASLEHGRRRTRRSTMERIAQGLYDLADPGDQPSVDVAPLVASWVEAAGPALAPESPYADRNLRRAKKRAQRRYLGRAVDIPGANWLIDLRARQQAERWIAMGRVPDRRDW